MSEIQQRFEIAQDEVVKFSNEPGVEDKIKLFALYKQASEGDASGERPGAIQYVYRAKWDAWSELQGTSQEQAKEQYIALVEQLKAACA